MRSSQRKAMPLLALLGLEVLAIVGLQAVGRTSTMRIPWGDLSNWLANSSIEEVAPAFVLLAALVVAYWLFVSTALCVIAQVSRIPAAVRATNMFALPSVRRVVDGAMVVSIATTSVMGSSAAAFASEAPIVPSSGDITTSISAQAGDLSVPTPTVGTPGDGTASVGGATLAAPASSEDTVPTPSPGAPMTTTSTAAPETTTTAIPETTTSIAGPQTTSTLTPAPSDDWVPTPDVGAPSTSTSTAAPTTTSTTVPQGPSTPAENTTTTAPPTASAPEPSAPQVEVLAATEHRVVAGENLWTIARDTLADTGGRSASTVSESEIRDYWLKVIDANRDTLRSKDPHWIFPGETITLPPTDAAVAAQ